MNIFTLHDDENRQLLDNIYRFNHIVEGQIDPGFFSFEDVLTEPLKGINKGANKLWFGLVSPANSLLSPITKYIDDYTGSDIQGHFNNLLDTFRENIDASTPDPSITTTVGQILNGLGDVMTRAGVGALSGGMAGAAILTGGTEAIYIDDEGRRRGLDPATAAGRATLEGATMGIGVLIPAAPFAKSLLARLASGATSNTALGISQRALTGTFLEFRGYEDMAQQYQVWDKTAIAADLVLGAAFGGLAHANTPIDLHIVDAALSSRNAQFYREDTAPGVPVDIPSSAAHQQALETAYDQLRSDEPVEVSGVDGVFDAHFIGRDIPEPQNLSRVTPTLDRKNTVHYPPDNISDSVVQDADPLLRDIDNANQILAKRGDIRIHTEDDEGNAMQRSAADMLREDDTLIANAEKEAQGFIAAIECELRHGTQ